MLIHRYVKFHHRDKQHTENNRNWDFCLRKKKGSQRRISASLPRKRRCMAASFFTILSFAAPFCARRPPTRLDRVFYSRLIWHKDNSSWAGTKYYEPSVYVMREYCVYQHQPWSLFNALIRSLSSRLFITRLTPRSRIFSLHLSLARFTLRKKCQFLYPDVVQKICT